VLNLKKGLFLKNLQKIFIVFTIFTFLNSCGGIPKAGDARQTPVGAKERARKNIEEGRGVSLKNFRDSGKTTYQFSSSNPLWRATFDVIDFMPLVTVDYSGGMIITDWYTDSNTTNDALKFTIRFLSNEVRSDSLKIIIHRKTCKSNQSNCIVKKIASKLEDTIRSEIIKKAVVLDAELKDKKKGKTKK
jgi:hypothetical protein|tara:strand:+ start:155 stop:721 length:567 start_codon:yes stop_codon:yes gene_type:complete